MTESFLSKDSKGKIKEAGKTREKSSDIIACHKKGL